MQPLIQRGLRRALVAAALALAATLFVLPASARVDSRAGGIGNAKTALYIVQMIDAPVVAYEGGTAGLEATAPASGQKINPNAANVVKYAAHLDARHNALLSKVGGGEKVYDYRYTYNGFAARLTPRQLAAAKSDPSVLSVEKAEEVTMDTATTPAFVGLTDKDAGLWVKHNIKGENVIIGIIDSGIWPESASFSDRTGTGPNGQGGRLDYKQIPGWHGKCSPGLDDSFAGKCNQKLIGAQYFYAARGLEGIGAHEFKSPRDYNGHGTHTAGTAGGNEGVRTTGGAAVFGTVNGIAPRARIAAYKVCFDNGAGGCGANTGDSVAAIDQAVADGVDVINYSISGTRTNYLDAVEVAYLFAARAGVFVATSAGNSGPTATTVAHISPWLAAVAAGTHNRGGDGKVTLGNNGAEYTGASLTSGVGPASLVYAGAVKTADATAADAELCFPNSLDPAKVTGKIVLCDRGVNARVEKSATVKAAGGVGMVLRNLSPSSLNADLHSIPSVHVDEVKGAAIKAYIDAMGASATATIHQAVVNSSVAAPDVAAFSSRGPSLAGGGDILKPDFMAPGVDILAAVAPPGNAGKDFDIYSGTSMSSPHVAGYGALLTQARPTWSPAAMRSAMATTADATSRAGLSAPLNVGSGHVRPNRTIDPGLVYDAGYSDYLAFLKGQGLCCATSASIPALDASDLNQPSIAIGDLAGSQTVKRTVTNVGAAGTYTATVAAPLGFDVTVNPSTLNLAPGAKATFEVTVTRTSAPVATFRFGSLTWSDGTHSVRSPIAVRAVAIAAPAEVTGTGTSGTRSYSIKTGYAGSLAYAKQGLIPSTEFAGTVPDDPDSNFNTGNPAGNKGITAHDFAVPAGTVLVRISMFDPETDGDDDIDLYLYSVGADGALTLAGSSGGGTSAEQIQLAGPAAGNYRVFVHGWETDGPDANYKLHVWNLGDVDASNMTVTGPATATIGGTATVDLSWSGLAAGKKYLGRILYKEGTTTHGNTVVRVDG